MKVFTLVFISILLLTATSFGQTESEMLIEADSLARLQDFSTAKIIYNQLLEKNPDCSRCIFGLGQFEAIFGNYKKAIELIEQSIVKDSSDADAYFLKAMVSLIVNDPSSSPLNDFNKAISINPTKAQFFQERGVYYSSKGTHSRALKDFEKAHELSPEREDPLYSIAQIYIEKEQWIKAIKYLDQCIEINSNNYTYFSNKAGVLVSLDSMQRGLEYYNKSIELDSTVWQSYLNRHHTWYSLEDMDMSCNDLGKTIELLKDVEEEKEMLQDLKVKYNSFCDDSKAAYYYQRGIAAFNLNEFDKSVEYYNKGIEKFSTNAMIRSFRGNSLMRLNKYEEALIDFQYVLKNRTKLKKDAIADYDDDGKYLAAVVAENFVSMAEASSELGKFEEANMYCDSAETNIKKHDLLNIPDFKLMMGSVSNYRGITAMNAGKFKEAKRYFENALGFDSKKTGAYYNIAFLMVIEEEQKLERSRHWISNIAYSNPTATPLELKFFKIGDKEIDKNNISQALGLLNSILKEEKIAEYFLLRGYIKKMLKMPDACLDFQSAKNLNSTIGENFIKEFCTE